MIITIGTNGNPTNLEGASHKEDFNVITRESLEQTSFNFCDLKCPYAEPKFSEAGAIVDNYKNDKTDLLITIAQAADTVTFKIFKCEDGEEVLKATISDNTYGTYFAPSYFPDQLKYGFLADWNLIYNAFDHGR